MTLTLAQALTSIRLQLVDLARELDLRDSAQIVHLGESLSSETPTS